MNAYRFEGLTVQITEQGVDTLFDSGEILHSGSTFDEDSHERADILGYGASDEAVIWMNREHDLIHHLVGHALGHGHSYVLAHEAGLEQNPEPIRDFEERMVMLVARTANAGIQEILHDFLSVEAADARV